VSRNTVFGQIINEHLVAGEMIHGQEIGISIDQTLTQDATGTMAALEFESLGFPTVKTELSVNYVDHNTFQDGFENADDHVFLRTFSAKYGAVFSRPGNGICHQVHLERFALPGKTMVGSDSHTPTAGGIGSVAIGAGGLDVAVAMGGGPYHIVYPRVVRVELTGSLQPWVSAKDIILELLLRLSTRGNVGTVMEYGGPGVSTLSIHERATITNMGAELGVTTSIFPSDEITRDFLRAQGRESGWRQITAPPDAGYDAVIEINLGSLVPLAALPHSPENVVPVSDVEGTAIDQVCIGSCTNSSFKDLMTVAGILKGKTAHPGLSLTVAPGSRQVLLMIAQNGGLEQLIASGARIVESACGFCIGSGQAPPSNGVSVRTNNRNFKGRCGTESAGVFLVSPEVAAVSALTGEIRDPRNGFGNPPHVTMPERFVIDDSMFIHPQEDTTGTEIHKGPNIGIVPENPPCPDLIQGNVALKVGDRITTDHIMPAGRYLKYRSNVKKYAEFVFSPIDDTFAKRSLALAEEGHHVIIVGGDGYGQGSSREHAALCPMYLGVKAVIAKSIERIHAANLINFGIIPLTFISAGDYDRVEQSDVLTIRDIQDSLNGDGIFSVSNVTRDFTFDVQSRLSNRQKEILLDGGLLSHVKNMGRKEYG